MPSVAPTTEQRYNQQHSYLPAIKMNATMDGAPICFGYM